MEIPSREEYGTVWMGDMNMMLPNESNDSIMEQPVDEPFFVDPNAQNMEGFMMLDDLDESTRWYNNEMSEEIMINYNQNEETSSEKLQVNTSTQTGYIPPVSRKIKPIKHPGLKLKTPIAYQSNTDVDVIPIQKEGRAVCKTCGAIGVKHAFYTRSRCYCSLACARGSVDANDEMSPPSGHWTEDGQPTENTESMQFSESKLGLKYVSNAYLTEQENLLESQLPPAYPLAAEIHPKTQHSSGSAYDWNAALVDPFFCAAPTTCFQHAPMSDLWHTIEAGLKVEVENTDGHDFSDEFPNTFWIATILRIEGYKALLRYEGFGNDDGKDFWVNLCSSSVHPVGYCAVRGKPLIPPKSIKNKYSNWKEFLKHRLTGARTLPSNFYNKVKESLKSRFRCDLTVEVVNKIRISEVTVATIEKVVGKRLQLQYFQSDPKDKCVDVFWCHEDSPLIHPVGWARRIGQKLNASPEYHDRMLKGLREKDDATADLFLTPERFSPSNEDYFQEGMKLEAIDPLNLGDICVATVMQVLNEGYLMIRVDFWNDQNPSTDDWFCYHRTSPCIFPAGFCVANGISLTPPKDYNRSNFDWARYLQETGCIPAPSHLFNIENVDHGFKVGMKLEAADLMNPRLVCVATVNQVVGRLLKIHFDGWENEFDQWIDCNSCDIYPVGWCELVGHKLEPPLSDSKPIATENRPIRTKKKTRTRNIGCIKQEAINEGGGRENLMTEVEQNIKLEQPKLIPRLSEYKSRTSVAILPESWDTNDVSEFLKLNDCSSYCESFIKQGIDGKKLLGLTKDDVLILAGMKVGPSLKIQNLISQLISKSHGPSRYSKSSKNVL